MGTPNLVRLLVIPVLLAAGLAASQAVPPLDAGPVQIIPVISAADADDKIISTERLRDLTDPDTEEELLPPITIDVGDLDGDGLPEVIMTDPLAMVFGMPFGAGALFLWVSNPDTFVGPGLESASAGSLLEALPGHLGPNSDIAVGDLFSRIFTGAPVAFAGSEIAQAKFGCPMSNGWACFGSHGGHRNIPDFTSGDVFNNAALGGAEPPQLQVAEFSTQWLTPHIDLFRLADSPDEPPVVGKEFFFSAGRITDIALGTAEVAEIVFGNETGAFLLVPFAEGAESGTQLGLRYLPLNEDTLNPIDLRMDAGVPYEDAAGHPFFPDHVGIYVGDHEELEAQGTTPADLCGLACVAISAVPAAGIGAGEVWVLGPGFAAEAPDLIADASFNSVAHISGVPNAHRGIDVTVGDVNDDGVEDLAIGVPGADSGAALGVAGGTDPSDETGAVYVIYGPLGPEGGDLTDLVDRIYVGNEPGQLFGGAVTIADLSSDGTEDVLISARRFVDRPGDERGGLFIFLGESDAAAPPPVDDGGDPGDDSGDGPSDDGDTPAGTVAINAGGQFLFWSLGPGTTASDWFNPVTIAWLFSSDLVAWTSYVPALGVVDFALVDGAVLWVVSPTAQDLSPGG